MSEEQGSMAGEEGEIRAIIAQLKKSRARETDHAVDLVLRLLKVVQSDPEVLPFVKGLRRGNVHCVWGDNGRSFWAHLYPIQQPSGGTEVVVTLERDGGIDDFIGVFASRESALDALRAIGKYGEL